MMDHSEPSQAERHDQINDQTPLSSVDYEQLRDQGLAEAARETAQPDQENHGIERGQDVVVNGDDGAAEQGWVVTGFLPRSAETGEVKAIVYTHDGTKVRLVPTGELASWQVHQAETTAASAQPERHETMEFGRWAPTLSEQLSDHENRGQLLDAYTRDFTNNAVRGVATERQMLQNLDGYIDQVITTAQAQGQSELATQAADFRDHLAYIGQPELAEAVEGLTARWVEAAKRGEDTCVFVHGTRSERYVTLLMAESFVRQTQDDIPLQRHLKTTERADRVADFARQHPDGHVVLVDDVRISGRQIQNGLGRLLPSLKEAGLSRDQIQAMVEVNVMAAPEPQPGSRSEVMATLSDGDEIAVRQHSYFKARRYDSVYPGVSITSSHSASDYGFEEFLRVCDRVVPIQSAFEQGRPLPIHLAREYADVGDQLAGDSNKIADEKLHRRWRDVRSWTAW